MSYFNYSSLLAPLKSYRVECKLISKVALYFDKVRDPKSGFVSGIRIQILGWIRIRIKRTVCGSETLIATKRSTASPTVEEELKNRSTLPVQCDL
jgi:hypothetical protein